MCVCVCACVYMCVCGMLPLMVVTFVAIMQPINSCIAYEGSESCSVLF